MFDEKSFSVDSFSTDSYLFSITINIEPGEGEGGGGGIGQTDHGIIETPLHLVKRFNDDEVLLFTALTFIKWHS